MIFIYSLIWKLCYLGDGGDLRSWLPAKSGEREGGLGDRFGGKLPLVSPGCKSHGLPSEGTGDGAGVLPWVGGLLRGLHFQGF